MWDIFYIQFSSCVHVYHGVLSSKSKQMFSWFYSSPRKVGFDDVCNAINRPKIWIINTLPRHEQDCLIRGTISHETEEKHINDLLQHHERDSYTIILYGKHALDETLDQKHRQLCALGFSNDRIVIYYGGLFEWLLLQDVYGTDLFPTTSVCNDLLRFKPQPVLQEREPTTPIRLLTL